MDLQHLITALEQKRAEIDHAIAALRNVETLLGKPINGMAPATRTAAHPIASLESLILGGLRADHGMPAASLAKDIDRPKFAVKKELLKLLKDGKVKRYGASRGTRWMLPGKTPAKEGV